MQILNTTRVAKPEHGPTHRARAAAPHPAAHQPASADADDLELQRILDRQQARFDYELAERAELQREMNALRALEMEQLKRDDENLKEWIRLI